MLARLTTVAVPIGALAFACAAHAATILPLHSPEEFTSALVITNDFETAVDTPEITFDGSASRMPANRYTRNVTTSGFLGLVETRRNEPLMAVLGMQAFEVGLYFGNDDFGLLFDVILSVFDADGVELGSVSVGSNGNDFVDQFIGLRSDTGFSSVGLAYTRPDAGGLSLFIDDFSIGIGEPAVGEPPVHFLLLPALAGMALAARPRRRHARR